MSWYRSARFYEEIFLNAFPMLFEDVEEESYMTKEEILGSAYTLRTLVRFAGFPGLIDIKRSLNKERGCSFITHNLIKLPLLDEVVKFNV